jgi:hypothetical protein
MFIVPLVMAVVFTLLSIMSLKDKQADVVGFFSSLISAVCWFIFSLTWSGIATSEIFRSVSYLWMALGYIFSIITLYVGMKMLLAILQEKPSRPLLQLANDDGV